MKLYEKFADNGFHSSIVTTFGIDFDAYNKHRPAPACAARDVATISSSPTSVC